MSVLFQYSCPCLHTASPGLFMSQQGDSFSASCFICFVSLLRPHHSCPEYRFWNKNIWRQIHSFRWYNRHLNNGRSIENWSLFAWRDLKFSNQKLVELNFGLTKRSMSKWLQLYSTIITVNIYLPCSFCRSY